MLPLAFAAFHVAATTLAARALGSVVGARWLAGLHPCIGCATRTAVGYLMLSLSIFAMAAANLVRQQHLWVLFIGVLVMATGWTVRRLWRPRARRARAGNAAEATSASLAEVWFLTLFAAVFVAWTLACAMLPATAPDELIHHLAVPLEMLRAGRLVIFPDNVYAYFPALGEMLFLFGLGVGGETAARLSHGAFAFVLGLAIYGYSRQFLSPRLAAWPVIVFFTVPSVMVIVPWAYVDLTFAFYAFLAVVFLIEYLERREFHLALLSGVMAGGALSTKYTGLQLMLLLVGLVLGEHLFTRRRGLPTAAALIPATGVLVALPYLARTFVVTGWPLFPFPLGDRPVPSSINWDLERAALFLSMLASYGSSTEPVGPATLWDAVTAPFLVFIRAAFNDPRWYDGQVGAIFLAAPLALRANMGKRLAVAGFFALAFLLYWGFTVRQVRFLLPALPLAAILVVVALSSVRLGVASAIVVGFVTINVAAGVREVLAREPLAFWFGRETREAYLSRRVAGYPILMLANRGLTPGASVYLINMRNYGYYLDRAWRSDFVFETYHLQRQLATSSDPVALRQFFASRGATHVMLDERLTYAEAALTPVHRAALQSFFATHAALVGRVDGRALYALSGS